MYATPADLVQRFGAEELAQVADRATPREVTPALLQLAIAADPLAGWASSDVTAVNAALANIEGAIGDAQSAVDAYLSARYTVPLATPPKIVQRMVCDVARYYLHGDQASDAVVKAFDAAMALCRDISTGKIAFGDVQSPKADSGVVEMVSGTRLWSRENRGL